MKMRLSKKTVEAAAVRDKPYLIMDVDLPGFGLRVERSGRKTYLVRYRLRGQRTEARVGDAAVVPPAQARDQAKTILARVAAGDDPRQTPARTLTVGALCERYADACEKYYRGPDGAPTSMMHAVRRVLAAAKSSAKTVPVGEFGPRNLADIRERWIAEGLARKTINTYAGILKNMFRWGAAQEMVPVSVHHALQAVPGLRKHRSGARETDPVKPAPPEDVKAVKAQVSAPVAALIDLLLLTGARPAELTALRRGDIDTSGALWSVRPHAHKTAHIGKDRVIVFGPKAQDILRPLMQREPSAYLFSPRDAEQERYSKASSHRRPNQAPSPRKTGRTLGEYYTPGSLRKAVQRACTKAGLPVWTPYQLRHSAATAIRKRYGLEAAQVLLGHSRADVTQIYAERDFEIVKGIMEKEG